MNDHNSSTFGSHRAYHILYHTCPMYINSMKRDIHAGPRRPHRRRTKAAESTAVAATALRAPSIEVTAITSYYVVRLNRERRVVRNSIYLYKHASEISISTIDFVTKTACCCTLAKCCASKSSCGNCSVSVPFLKGLVAVYFLFQFCTEVYKSSPGARAKLHAYAQEHVMIFRKPHLMTLRKIDAEYSTVIYSKKHCTHSLDYAKISLSRSCWAGTSPLEGPDLIYHGLLAFAGNGRIPLERTSPSQDLDGVQFSGPSNFPGK